MKQCKITVIKTNFFKDLADQYGVKCLGPCPVHKEGQVFYVDFDRPEGFCPEAWKSLHYFVFALSHGGGEFFNNYWLNEKHISINTCNDGLRPVVFKIERIEKDAVLPEVFKPVCK